MGRGEKGCYDAQESHHGRVVYSDKVNRGDERRGPKKTTTLDDEGKNSGMETLVVL